MVVWLYALALIWSLVFVLLNVMLLNLPNWFLFCLQWAASPSPLFGFVFVCVLCMYEREQERDPERECGIVVVVFIIHMVVSCF